MINETSTREAFSDPARYRASSEFQRKLAEGPIAFEILNIESDPSTEHFIDDCRHQAIVIATQEVPSILIQLTEINRFLQEQTDNWPIKV